MRSPHLARLVALPLAVLSVSAVATVSRADESKGAPPAIVLPTTPPKGAVVLFDGKAATLQANWGRRNSKDPAGWTVGADGSITPNRTDITSKQEFGDVYLHVEFRCPTTGHGNAGIGLQGRYEVQIYGKEEAPNTTNAAAFYNQKPAAFEVSKPRGEWQTYDIIFRAPRFGADGKVTEGARATVFFNGVLVHANNEFAGPTGIEYGDFPGMAKTGPIVLQGDHEAVQYRNIWALPL